MEELNSMVKYLKGIEQIVNLFDDKEISSFHSLSSKYLDQIWSGINGLVNQLDNYPMTDAKKKELDEILRRDKEIEKKMFFYYLLLASNQKDNLPDSENILADWVINLSKHSI